MISLAIVEKMKENSCEPNINTYNGFKNGFIQGNWVLEGEKLFEKLLARGVVLTIFRYTTLIDGFFKAGVVDHSFIFLDELVCQVYQPNIHTYI